MMTLYEDYPGTKKCVLVVDDTLLVRRYVGKLFADAGYRVVSAQNGEEALRAAQENGPDLIVMDVMMPVMDGIEALRKFRQDGRFKSTPVVMLTGENERATVSQILSEGVTDYIVKDSLGDVKQRLKKYL